MNILLICYKINRDQGSEDAIGYHLTKAILGKVPSTTLLTQGKNIERLKYDENFKNCDFIAYDLPIWFKRFKFSRFGVGTYYYIWQICVGCFIFRRFKKSFDIIHQINFGFSCVPHFIRNKGAKIFWGPLMRHERLPRDFWFGNSVSYFFQEYVVFILKNILLLFDPFLKHAISVSRNIFWATQPIPSVFISNPNKSVVVLAAGSNLRTTIKYKPDLLTIIYVGRFVDLKGCVLAAESFYHFALNLPENLQSMVQFRMVGQGPRKIVLEKFVALTKQQTKTLFTISDWIPHNAVANIYDAAHILLFPSFEGQGLVVAEALTYGCPVLCLDNTGPSQVAENAAITVQKSNYQKIRQDLSMQLKMIFELYHKDRAAYQELVAKALHQADMLSWDRKANQFIRYYHE